MCETVEDLLNELDAVDIEDMDDRDEYVNKDDAEDLIRRGFDLGKKLGHDLTARFHHVNDSTTPPKNKYLLVKFEGEREGGEFQFCIRKGYGWFRENEKEAFPTFWSYVEKPD